MSRFMRKGTTKLYWVASISDITAPTAAEMGSAVALTDEIAEINGFSFSNSPIDVPDMGDAFVSRIPGEDTVGDSSIMFYERTDSNTIMTTLAKDTTGYVVIFPTGIAGVSPAANDTADIWPATVASNARQYNAGNEAARFEVVFTLTASPAIDADVVA